MVHNGYFGKDTPNLGKRLVDVAILLILFYPPFFQGLFFEIDVLRAGIFLALTFFGFYFVHKVRRQEFILFPSGLMEYGLTGLWAAYLISLFVAIRPSAALESVIRLTIYTLVFIMVSRSFKSIKELSRVLSAIYATGVIVAIVGLAGYTGWDLKGVMYSDRISSTFQYPNTLGSYLSFIFVTGMYLANMQNAKAHRVVISGLNVAVILALYGTLSRGAFLVLPIALLIYVLLQPKGRRLQEIIGIISISVVAAVFLFLVKETRSQAAFAWIIILCGIVTGGAIRHGVDLLFIQLNDLDGKIKKKVLIAVVLVIAVIGTGVFGYLAKNGTLTRLTQISLKEHTVVERGYFYADAFKIIKDYPLLGTGGGGWASIYKQYRSYGYNTREVHNFYLQTWVETGIPGMIAIIVIFIGTFAALVRVYRSFDDSRQSLVAVLFSSIFVLAAHSAIDVTMSFGALGIILWTFLAGLRGLELGLVEKTTGVSKIKSSLMHRAWIYSLPALVTAFLIVTGSLYIGLGYSNDAVEAIRKNDIKAEQEALKKAIRFDPLRPQYYSWLARGERLASKGNKIRQEQALQYAEKAVELDKTNQEYHLVRANMLFLKKDVENAVKEVETAALLDPWNQETYDVLTYMYTMVGKYYLHEGRMAEGELSLKKALEVPRTMKKKVDGLGPEKLNMWVNSNTLPPTLSDNMKKNIQEIFHIMTDMGIKV